MKQIPLTQGRIAVVDDRFYAPLVAMGSWYFHHTGYAQRNGQINGRRYTKLMHRIVIELAGLYWPKVDHRNQNKLDNRLDNLRPSTHGQNMQNRSVRRDSKTGFRGVWWGDGRWVAEIRAGGEKYRLGRFHDKLAAAAAYDLAAMELHGEFAGLRADRKITSAFRRYA